MRNEDAAADEADGEGFLWNKEKGSGRSIHA